MIKKVLSFVEQHHMIESGDHIVAGISGGADSVCLLLVLQEIQNIYGCRITAVHVEHGIRGAESRQDADFVQELCKCLSIPCKVYYYDAVTFAKEQGMSLEEGARELRYGCFMQVKDELGANKIAIAHNQNDCAETLLFHLARGTGLKGMCGIVPVRECIIRPLLGVSRKEIEEFLAEKRQEFCIDITNLDVQYSRNKIRHQVLPVLQEINSGAVEHLYKSTRYIAEAAELIDELVKQAKEECVKRQKKEIFVLENRLTTFPRVIQKTLILEVIGMCAGSRKDISEVHVEQVRELFFKQSGKGIMLPYDLRANRTYEGIEIFRVTDKEEEKGTDREVYLAEPGTVLEIPELDLKITCRVLEISGNFQEIPKKTYTKWFDYDKIKGKLLLRRRCQGDYLVIDKEGRKQSLKKYFINEKIPGREREEVLLLAEEDHVLWAIGYRISDAYKVTADTRRVLEVQVDGGSIDE